MTYYVEIKYLNGRYDLSALAQKLDERGYDDRVEYNAGGWSKNSTDTVLPHLRFIDEADALAYVLAYSGTISTTVPTRRHMYAGG